MTDLAEVAATIENLPNVLAMLLDPIDPTSLTTRPEPGEWSVHEVIGHLITCDGPAFRDRIEAIVGGAERLPQFRASPSRHADFNEADLRDLLIDLAEQRTLSAAMLRSLSPDDLARTSVYGEGETFAAGDFVHEWPFHDHDHLQQILASLKLAHIPGMSMTMRTALNVG